MDFADGDGDILGGHIESMADRGAVFLEGHTIDIIGFLPAIVRGVVQAADQCNRYTILPVVGSAIY